MSVDLHIKKNFGRFKLNIEYRGESRRIGILGASGSGKSLMLKSIAGIETPNYGFVNIDGRVLFDSRNKVDIAPQKRKTGYMFQSLALFENMSVEKNIKAGIKKDADVKAREIMEDFGLSELADRLPSQLSQGQRQRTALARIIASEPEVILLDEPFSSLDSYMRDEMQTNLINTLKYFKGTVITVSHSYDEIYALSDELIVIDNGKICTYGKTDDIFRKPPDRISAVLTGCENIAAVKYRNNKIYIPDWDIELTSDIKNAEYVAVRANSFLLEDNGNSICLDVAEPKVKKGPFDNTIFFKPSERAVGKICFKISPYDNIPDKIYLDKSNLLIIY